MDSYSKLVNCKNLHYCSLQIHVNLKTAQPGFHVHPEVLPMNVKDGLQTRKKYCRMGNKTSLLVNKNLILSMMNIANQLLAISHLPS